LDAIPQLAAPGPHNRINAACAAAAATADGCGIEAINRGLESFRGLPQRLELLAVIDGRRFYNDSSATTPESAIAALAAIDQPVWLLAGGRDKGFDFRDLAAAVASGARGAAFFGEAAEMLRENVVMQCADVPCTAHATLEQSLGWCWEHSRQGDAIVLSPACSSHDQYRNFKQRGESFAAMVAGLAQEENRRTPY